MVIHVRKPLVGIIGNSSLINGEYLAQSCGVYNIEAIAQVADALPLVVPSHPDKVSVADLINTFDGFVLPGGRPNVHPEEYGEEETPAHGTFNRDRDRLVQPLIRAAVDAGIPILGLCLGFQEINVAFGGTLYPEIRELPGRMNHRMPPDGTIEEKFALRHEIELVEGGVFAEIFGSTRVMTNSLHGQGIKRPGERIIIEGHAPDGTPEAIRVKDAPNFALGVQWHAEYKAADDPVSRPLFQAFGRALRR